MNRKVSPAPSIAVIYDEDTPRLVVAAELVSPNEDDVERQVAERIAAHTRNQVVAQAIPIQELDSDDKKDQSVPSWSVKRLSFVHIAIIVALLVVVVCVAVTAGVLVGKENNDNSESANSSPSASPTHSGTLSPSTASDPFRILLDPWIIRPDKKTDLDVFNDPESPQSLALQWLTTDSISNSENSTNTTVLERYVLMVLYYSTDGDRWSGKGLSFTKGVATCDWNHGAELYSTSRFGIYCDDQQTVTQISLIYGGLSGTIPWELSLLSDLVTLNFNANHLKGTIPSAFRQLIGLRILWLSNNELTGTLPGDLPLSLQFMDLRFNRFSGTLPQSWGKNLQYFMYLVLAENQLTGSIPSSWQSSWTLDHLNLAFNFFTGTIPITFFESCEQKFKRVYLEGNLFSGSLPSELAQCTLLENLYISDNNFSGTIPTEFGKLTAMRLFHVNSNSLTGPLPSELGQLSALNQIWIDNNDFTGTVPTELAQLPNLMDFSFHANNLTGSVNDTLCAANRSRTILQGDCAADGSGYVEIECPCCAACCLPTIPC